MPYLSMRGVEAALIEQGVLVPADAPASPAPRLEAVALDIALHALGMLAREDNSDHESEDH